MLAAAEAIFQKVLKQEPNQPRALYGLAIASVLGGKAEVAKDLFQKVVSPSAAGGNAPGAAAAPDPTLLAWSHIYLGRIHDLEGERDLAVGEYQSALAVMAHQNPREWPPSAAFRWRTRRKPKIGERPPARP